MQLYIKAYHIKCLLAQRRFDTKAEPRSPRAPLPPDRKLTPVEEQEYRLIRATLRACHGGIRRSATKLGLCPQALLRRLEKWPELRETKS